MHTQENQVDFSSNINAAYDTSFVLELIRTHPEFVLSYGDYKQSEIRQYIAQILHIPEDCIYLGAGTTDLLFTLPRILGAKSAIMQIPTFWEYPLVNERAGVDIIKIPTSKNRQFDLDLSALSTYFSGSTAVYLCNPNNPTSRMLQIDDLKTLVEQNPAVKFVVDETYLIFREDYNRHSLLRFSVDLPNLFVVTSLSKFFSIPGLRLGILTSSAENVSKFRQSATPYLLNPLAEIVIPALFADPQKIITSRAENTHSRLRLQARLRSEFNGILQVYTAEANFLLLEIMTEMTSTELAQLLDDKGFRIRDGVEFEGLNNKWFRISVKTDEDNDRLLASLKQILGASKNGFL